MVNRIFGQSYFVFVRVGLLRVVVVGVSCCLAIGPWRLRGSGVGLDERNNQPFEGSNTHRRGNVARTSRVEGSNTAQQSTVGCSGVPQPRRRRQEQEQVHDDDTTTSTKRRRRLWQ